MVESNDQLTMPLSENNKNSKPADYTTLTSFIKETAAGPTQLYLFKMIEYDCS